MKHDIAKRSAANRKAWRTRKRMAQVRREAVEEEKLTKLEIERATHLDAFQMADFRVHHAYLMKYNRPKPPPFEEWLEKQLTKKQTGSWSSIDRDGQLHMAKSYDNGSTEMYVWTQDLWPAYMTRALPNPWGKDLPPW